CFFARQALAFAGRCPADTGVGRRSVRGASDTHQECDQPRRAETAGLPPCLHARSECRSASLCANLDCAPPLQRLTLEVGLVLPAQHTVGLVHPTAIPANGREPDNPRNLGSFVGRLATAIEGSYCGCREAVWPLSASGIAVGSDSSV